MAFNINNETISTENWANTLQKAAGKHVSSKGKHKIRYGKKSLKLDATEISTVTKKIMSDNEKTTSLSDLKKLQSSFSALASKDKTYQHQLQNSLSSSYRAWKQKHNKLGTLSKVCSFGFLHLVDKQGKRQGTRAEIVNKVIQAEEAMAAEIEEEIKDRVQEVPQQIEKRDNLPDEQRYLLLQDANTVYSWIQDNSLEDEMQLVESQLDKSLANWANELKRLLSPDTFATLDSQTQQQTLREARTPALSKNRTLLIERYKCEVHIAEKAQNYEGLSPSEQNKLEPLLLQLNFTPPFDSKENANNFYRFKCQCQLSLRDNGVKTPIQVPRQEQINQLQLTEEFSSATFNARNIPPVDTPVDIMTIYSAFFDVAEKLPTRINDDFGHVSREKVEKNLRITLSLAKQYESNTSWGRSKSALEQLAHHIQVQKENIESESNEEERAKLQDALDLELVQIFRDQLGPGVCHCSDRLQLASEQIYFERIAKDEPGTELTLEHRLKRKVAAAREDIFREVATAIAKKRRVDQSSFAQTALQLYGERAGIPLSANQQSSYAFVFANDVRVNAKEIIRSYKEAYNKVAIDLVADEVSYDEMLDFLSDRFEGLFDYDEDSESDEPWLEAPIMKFVTEDNKKANKLGLALIMQEIGMVKPFT